MYIEINESDFVREFQSVRPEQFSVAALRALFRFLEEMEQDTGEPTELDVIAICCDWAEYDEDEIRREYDHIDRISEAVNLDELAEILNEETMVIQTDDSLVVLAF